MRPRSCPVFIRLPFRQKGDVLTQRVSPGKSADSVRHRVEQKVIHRNGYFSNLLITRYWCGTLTARGGFSEYSSPIFTINTCALAAMKISRLIITPHSSLGASAPFPTRQRPPDHRKPGNAPRRHRLRRFCLAGCLRQRYRILFSVLPKDRA